MSPGAVAQTVTAASTKYACLSIRVEETTPRAVDVRAYAVKISGKHLQHTHEHTYEHTNIHTCIQTHTYVQTYIRTYIQNAHAQTHTHVYKIHKCTGIQTYVQTYTCIRTKHTHMYIQIYALLKIFFARSRFPNSMF